MKSVFRLLTTVFALVLGIVGVSLVLYAWRLPPFAGTLEMTDNAYVRGQVTLISPQLAGYVSQVPVKDYETVKAGQVLARIDDRIYKQKVNQAQATLNTQQAQIDALEQKRLSAAAKLEASKAQVNSADTAMKTAQLNYDRNVALSKTGAIARSAFEQASSTLENARAALVQAHANQEVAEQDLASVAVSREGYVAAVAAARAALELARIDLSNTVITAPTDGRLGEVGVRLGQYVTAGSQLMAVVPQKIWVTANFKETQVEDMIVGKRATFTVDALGHRTFTGRIESLSPAAGSEFSVLKADNATGNFTKVAQRLPVRISIDAGQSELDRLAPGMSVVVSVDTKQADAELASR